MMRRESALWFEVDEPFQMGGGVQYFYELARSEPSPEVSNKTFVAFRPLDVGGRWASKSEPLHVVMSRLVYTIDKDSSFFTERRARDLVYLNAVAPGLGIVRLRDGDYRAAGGTPANSFRLRWLEGPALSEVPRESGLERLLELCAAPALPSAVVVQDNFDFSRVMGWRTADTSVTWTAHFPLSPGHTRLCVLTMSYLVNMPPFFLGGDDRVLNESVSGAAQLIRNLRAYRD